MKRGGHQDSAPRNTPPISVSHDVDRPSLARRGASQAFLQSPKFPKPPYINYNSSNGALAAASFVGSGGRKELFTVRDGGLSARQDNMENPRPSVYRETFREDLKGDVGNLQAQSREQSPSYRAAHLAALKAPTLRGDDASDISTTARQMSLHCNVRGEPPTAMRAQSDTSAPVTSSLVQLYESKRTTKPSASGTHSIRYASRPLPKNASPKSIKTLARATTSAISLPSPQQPPFTKSWPSHTGVIVVPARLADTSPKIATGSRQNPSKPPPQGSQPNLDGPTDGNGRLPTVHDTTGGLNLSKLDVERVSTPLTEAHSEIPSYSTRESDHLFAMHLPPESQKPSPTQASRVFDEGGQKLRSTRPHQGIARASDTFVPQLSVDSLANAMVASSLASSRAPSPSRPPPPPPRRHGKPHLFNRNHSQDLVSRTPSPAKGMRQTMREAQKSDDEAEHKQKSHLVRKHPNKHHEGDRKRYRSQVTERERKRFEGVWAANKGLLLPSSSSNMVLNVVVRDIWRRSRLPDDVLEEVWDLVSLQDLDRLEREEFVVGMWLIDQRLKGNKLPIKVSESVWSSAKRLTGITVPRNRR
ncbi:MAG: hypothetical protein Q9164_000056 [Protoblastenia rupestris]